MVKITYNKEHFTLRVEGHAGVAENGQDILCSAVSILTYTLAQIVLEHSGCMKTDPQIVLEDGNALIQCNPKPEHTQKIGCFFDTIMTGFDLLEKSYKKNIKILGGRVRES